MALLHIVDDELNFDQGSIICQSGGLSSIDGILTLRDGGTVADVRDSTYVEGPVKKVGNDASTFFHNLVAPMEQHGTSSSFGLRASGFELRANSKL